MRRALVALPLLLPLLGAAPEPPAVVARAARVYGAMDDGERVRTLMASWKYERHEGDGEAEGKETGELFEQVSFPDRLRREYRRHRKHRYAIVSGTDGTRAWRVRPGHGTDPVRPSDFYVPLRVRAPAWLLSEVVEGKARAETAPGAEPGQQRVIITRHTGEMLTLDIDKKRGLIRRYEGSAAGLTSTDRLTVRIDGWERRDGLWFPTRLSTWRNDELVEELRLEALQINGHVMEDLYLGPFGPAEPPSRKL